MGDLEAAEFVELFEEWWPAVRSYAARRVGPATCEDVAAEAFTEVWASRHTFDRSRGAPAAWMWTIVSRVTAKRLRRTFRDGELAARAHRERDDLVDLEALVDRVGSEQAAHRVAGVLGRLRPADRDLIELVALAEFSYTELSSILDQPVGTLKSRVSRLRRRLQAELRSEGVAT